MKTAKHSKRNGKAKFIRVDNYTWIEKKLDEPDEVTRQRFIMKLTGIVNSPVLRPGF